MSNNTNTNTPSLEEGKVYETTNYDIFKGVIGNRAAYEPHVRRLRKSLEAKNLLPQNPIIVNERMEVIDGQHRLLAARELGIPVYYVMRQGAGLEEIQTLNANNRAWLTEDYLESYIARGKKEYIQLQEFASQYRISIPIALMLLTDNYTRASRIRQDFKEGNFHVVDYKKAENMASLISEIRDHSPDGAWTHRACIQALAVLYDKTDPKALTTQLDRYGQIITRRPSVKDYLRQFENIIGAGREGQQIIL